MIQKASKIQSLMYKERFEMIQGASKGQGLIYGEPEYQSLISEITERYDALDAADEAKDFYYAYDAARMGIYQRVKELDGYMLDLKNKLNNANLYACQEVDDGMLISTDDELDALSAFEGQLKAYLADAEELVANLEAVEVQVDYAQSVAVENLEDSLTAAMKHFPDDEEVKILYHSHFKTHAIS